MENLETALLDGGTLFEPINVSYAISRVVLSHRCHQLSVFCPVHLIGHFFSVIILISFVWSSCLLFWQQMTGLSLILAVHCFSTQFSF